MNLTKLLTKHGARSWEKQMYLGKLLGDNPPDWFFSMSDGTLSFGRLFTFSIQLLGTESSLSDTWLWAWANAGSNIPPHLLLAAQQMREYGRQHKISAFTIPKRQRLSQQFHGHNLCMIASDICGAKAYYRGPYEEGALFLLIHDEDYPEDTRHPILRIAFYFPEYIQHNPVPDHAASLQAYCQSHGLNVIEGKVSLTAEHSDGNTLTATFDNAKRLTRIQTTVKGDMMG